MGTLIKHLYLIAFIFFFNINAFAFRPVAHIILQKEVAHSLPDNNKYAIAMKENPD